MGDALNFAIVVPMANEEPDFWPFVNELRAQLDLLKAGRVYCVVDDASLDRTRELCTGLSRVDLRFVTVYEPRNRCVAHAYLRGYREAFDNGHEIIIEMDAGMSHDPRAIPRFLRVLNEGSECAFGSRFMKDGSMDDANLWRRFLSRGGTIAANAFLGTDLSDMTSGFEGFRRHIVKELLDRHFRSEAHFFQTEVRYFLRAKSSVMVPIRYKTPSPRVSAASIRNAVAALGYYFFRRITGRAL